MVIQAAIALPSPNVPRCESPNVQTDGERTAALRLTSVGLWASCPSLIKIQRKIVMVLRRPQKRKEPRQPKSGSKRGVTSNPIPDPTCVAPPYNPCPSEACSPSPAATPAPATNAPPEPSPTSVRHSKSQGRLAKSGSKI